MLSINIFLRVREIIAERLVRCHLSLEVARFIITGSTASLSALLMVFILVDGFQLWPVWGTIIANLVSGTIGFLLHKHWTFKNKSKAWRRQAFAFIGLVGFNLTASAVLMYVMNDILGIWYLLDQVIIIFIMATVNFFINKLVIFRHQPI